MIAKDRSSSIELVPWTKDDLPLLVGLNSTEMTEHLGGPESPEQLDRRLQKYLAATTPAARMFKVVVDGVDAGSVGFWDREWKDQHVYETGWGILPAFQGQGLASSATALAIGMARALQRHDAMHAFPSVGNAPSNAICSKLEFELLGDHDFEYPRGHWMRCNDWRLRLR